MRRMVRRRTIATGTSQSVNQSNPKVSFDTADAYGSGLSNYLLCCLENPNIYIQSKVGYRWISESRAVLDLSTDNIISALTDTFDLFGSKLKAIMLHDICDEHSKNINALKTSTTCCIIHTNR